MTYCFPSKMYITVLLLTPLILLEINEKVTNGYSIILLIHYNLVTIYCLNINFTYPQQVHLMKLKSPSRRQFNLCGFQLSTLTTHTFPFVKPIKCINAMYMICSISKFEAFADKEMLKQIKFHSWLQRKVILIIHILISTSNESKNTFFSRFFSE